MGSALRCDGHHTSPKRSAADRLAPTPEICLGFLSGAVLFLNGPLRCMRTGCSQSCFPENHHAFSGQFIFTPDRSVVKPL
jgi:hypothetical protein